MGRLSRVAWLYIGAIVAAAVAVIAAGPFGGLDWVQVGALGLLLVACESSATLLNPRGLAWSGRKPRRARHELRKAARDAVY